LLIPALKKESPWVRTWPVRLFFGAVRFVES
jgi:hypothetical protein